MKLWFALGLALVGFGCSTPAPETAARPYPDPVIAPALPAFGPPPIERSTTPALRADRTVFEVGDIDQGTPITARVPIENIGDGKLRIWRVGCEPPLFVERADDPITPGGSGIIELRAETALLRGPVELHAVIPSNDPKRPRVDVTVRATVFPPLTTDPEIVKLSADAGQSATLDLVMRASRGGTFEIENIECRSREVTVGAPRRAHDGLTYTVPLELVPNARPHAKRTSLEVAMRRGEERKRVRLLVEVEHRDCLEFLPGAAVQFAREDLNAVKEGREKAVERSVTVRARSGAPPFHITGVALEKRLQGVIDPRIEEVKAGAEYRIVFTLAANGGRLRPMTGKATVSTDLGESGDRTITVQIL